MNKVIYKVRKYRTLKADIRYIELKLEELEEDLGITEQPQGERTGQTYKISSQVESQALTYIEKKEALETKKHLKEIEIGHIENAIESLDDAHREVIQLAHIELKAYWKIQEQLHKSYPRIKQIESEAAKHMERYLL